MVGGGEGVDNPLRFHLFEMNLDSQLTMKKILLLVLTAAVLALVPRASAQTAYVVDTFAALAGIANVTTNTTSAYAIVRGGAAAGDGLGGTFGWIRDSSNTTNEFSVFKATSSSVGRWIRSSPTMLTATAALDFPSIPANATTNLTITVTGAGVNDTVGLGPPAALTSEIGLTAFVSATNTVTVRAINPTGAAIDPASGTYRATVFRY